MFKIFKYNKNKLHELLLNSKATIRSLIISSLNQYPSLKEILAATKLNILQEILPAHTEVPLQDQNLGLIEAPTLNNSQSNVSQIAGRLRYFTNEWKKLP